MKLYNDDCLNILKTLPDESIDAIIADPPYGKYGKDKNTREDSLNWDKIIDYNILLKELKRVIKPQGAIILFCQAPFSFELYNNMIKEKFILKHQLYWKKSTLANFTSLKYGPCKYIEEIQVYSKTNKLNYYIPEVKIIKEKEVEIFPKHYITHENIDFDKALKNPKIISLCDTKEHCKYELALHGRKLNTILADDFKIKEEYKDLYRIDIKNKKIYRKIISKTGYPSCLLEYSNFERNILYPSGKCHHPTQKPVDLLKFLIEHYSLEGETILDFAMGSGSTGVACKKTNRNFIGIEVTNYWYNIAKERIEKE